MDQQPLSDNNPTLHSPHQLSGLDTESNRQAKPTGSGVRLYVRMDKERALELLTDHPNNVSEVCRMLGIARNTWHYHLNNDPQFAIRVQEIQEAACDALETTMLELGKKPSSYTFNDRIAYLRAHRPKLYNPARKIVVEGYTLNDSEARKRAASLDKAVDAQIVNAYTTRKERQQAKSEGSSLLPSADD